MKIAIILSGCGVFDGTEINEAVFIALALSKAGADYQFLAPNIEQHHVINHKTGNEADETRNVLIESARIARGNIIDLANASPDDYSAVIVPGGFGAAKNLSDYAFNNKVTHINAELKKFIQSMLTAKKPAGFACIAPVMIPQLVGKPVDLTIGNDASTAEAIIADGGNHVACAITDVVIDVQHNIVSTPAFMLSENLADVYSGIEKMVTAVIQFIKD
jgi:enhancing lycopene biosynthesis protein 2